MGNTSCASTKAQGRQIQRFCGFLFEAALRLDVFFFVVVVVGFYLFFYFFFYSMSLSEVISAPLSRSSSLRPISLFCLSLREHRYHRASGPAGNLDCGGGNGCLRLQTEAEVSK